MCLRVLCEQGLNKGTKNPSFNTLTCLGEGSVTLTIECLYQTAEQAEWLMKEHFKNQGAIERLYDDEISRQRATLEEKLARRRAHAQRHVSDQSQPSSKPCDQE